MKKKIAFFDFDGTLTYNDSTTLFYKSIYRNKYIYFYYNYILCFYEILIYLFDENNYYPLKYKRFKINLNKLSIDQFESYIKSFNKNILPSIIKSTGMDCILEHKKSNTILCIVSASFEFLLYDWCTKNGILLISNKIIKQDYNFIIIGDDCNFENKVNRISENFNLKNFDYIYAYGDSIGDIPMLSIANEKFYKYFN
jgi:phosphatidylglycerophosphatase C